MRKMPANILIPILVVIASFNGICQEIQNSAEEPIGPIHWIREFPATGAEKQKEGFFKRIGKFVTGKKDLFLSKPVALVAEEPNHLWVLDQGNGAVMEAEDEKVLIPDFFSKKTDQFPSLVGICKGWNDELIFTDSRQNKIYTTAVGRSTFHVLNDSLQLDQPTGIAFSAETNELWVVETGAHRIVVLDEQGNVVKTIGERGENPGKFNFPTHIWVDEHGRVYIVDSMNFRIQIYSLQGEWQSMFGKLGDATGYFSRPKGVATDSRGNIYVVDGLFHSVQAFGQSGEFLYYFGKQGREKGDFWLPSGIYIDKEDHIYIADSYNSRIQVFKFTNAEIK